MRTMIKIQVPVDAGNRAIAENKMGDVIGEIAAKAHPEAMYFGTDPVSGLRTAHFVCDLASSSDLPAMFEVAIQKLNATIQAFPVMTAEELKSGLGRAMQG